MKEAIRKSQAKRRAELRLREYIDVPGSKSCCRCKVEKPSSLFGFLKQSPDGLRAYCKPCENEWAMAKYYRDIDSSRANGRIHALAGYHRRPDAKAKARTNNANRRAREQAAEGRHSIADIRRLLEAQRFCCADCGKSIKDGYHVDHVVPISKGGSNWPTNLQILCPTCNISKGDRDPIEHAQKIGRLL